MANQANRNVPASFELEDLLSDLAQVYEANHSARAERPPNTYRTEEIMEVLELERHATLRRIRLWIKQGLCRPVKAPYENVWGDIQRVPMVEFIAPSPKLSA